MSVPVEVERWVVKVEALPPPWSACKVRQISKTFASNCALRFKPLQLRPRPRQRYGKQRTEAELTAYSGISYDCRVLVGKVFLYVFEHLADHQVRAAVQFYAQSAAEPVHAALRHCEDSGLVGAPHRGTDLYG